jgi:hypothetical protein
MKNLFTSRAHLFSQIYKYAFNLFQEVEERERKPCDDVS